MTARPAVSSRGTAHRLLGDCAGDVGRPRRAGPLTGLLISGKVRTLLSKELDDATRLSAEELARAEERVDRAAAQVRFAERLRTVAAEFAAAADSYNYALAGLDLPLRELLGRAAEELGGQALRYSYAPLRDRLACVVAAARLMEDQRPVMDEWRRQILLVMPSA